MMITTRRLLMGSLLLALTVPVAPADQPLIGRAGEGEGWVATVGGQDAGSYEGAIAIATVHNEAVYKVVLYTEQLGGDLEGTPGTKYLNVTMETDGSTPAQEGVWRPVHMSVMVADSPWYIASAIQGAASELQSGSGQNGFPVPPTLRIVELGAHWVLGAAHGTLYQSRPNGHVTKQSPATVEFVARACRYGSPGFRECTDPKLEWKPGSAP